MYYSKSFIYTLKESPQEAETASHKLMLRSGLVNMLMAGVYSYLPLGFKVLTNIENIIRSEMDKAGAQEVLLSCLQPLELWVKTERDQLLKEIMFTFSDRRSRNICLGPTHEEIITDLVSKYVQSYKQLPLVLYQIQTKFRDELRPRGGLVRACEFIMKDAYSFDQSQEGLEKNYKLQFNAYKNIFTRCGLDFIVTEADSGVMGGSVSHEFMVLASSGEDKIGICPKCKFAKAIDDNQVCPKCKEELKQENALEVGHIFQLGMKYSKALKANFLDAGGKKQPIIMGCYGIGVSRLISAIIEQHNDDKGIIWPKEVAPFKVEIVVLDIDNEKIFKTGLKLHGELEEANVSCLLDDRQEKAGIKFNDADLLGMPIRVTLGKEFVSSGLVEIKKRSSKEILKVNQEDALSTIKKILNEL